MTHHVLDNAGRPLDAHVDIDGAEIVFHSRGGTRGGANARNLDYGTALRLLLERIAAAGHRLTGVWVDSDEVRRLPRVDRSILTGADLLTAPADQFRILSRNMQIFGRSSHAPYGGSRVKKIRIAGDWPSDPNSNAAMLRLAADDGRPEPPIVVGSTGRGNSSGAPLQYAAFEAQIAMDEDPTTIFDPTSIEDGRERIATMLKRRQGQASFRRALFHAYGGRCAISGCAIEPLLEAAHIHPYRGPDTNSVQNGLLLRADLHSLFDVGLVTISEAKTVTVAPPLASTDYWHFDGQAITLPDRAGDRPSELALAWHRAEHAAQHVP
jgi:hypothetical protein